MISKAKYFLTIFLVITCGLLIGKIVILSSEYFTQKNTTNQKSSQNSFISKTQNDNSTNSDFKTPIKQSDLQKTITVTFVGDLMFDRYIRTWAEKNSYENIFKNVKNRLRESDLVVGNLEGPITNYETIYKNGSIANNYTFTFDVRVAQILHDANIKIVSLDNNHILNFGREGLKQTLDNLSLVGVAYFGNPDNREIFYREISGIKLAFLSYNEFIKTDVLKLSQDIKTADEHSDYVIVFPHWGNEYEKKPTVEQINLAHEFIDNGADFVIGAHPHVIQSKEIYKNKHIYYSLGNFVFDQYFNENVKCGGMVTFELDKINVRNLKE